MTTISIFKVEAEEIVQRLENSKDLSSVELVLLSRLKRALGKEPAPDDAQAHFDFLGDV
jgi:hypothetical protein